MSISELARTAVEPVLAPLARRRLVRAGVHDLAGLDQVFECAGGRLLLRGDDRAAAEALRVLCLPLDADIRRALGRTPVLTPGFVWLEFAHDGRSYVLGAAVGPERARFFVTPVPVGASLPLDDPVRRPSLADLPNLVGAGAAFDEPSAYLERVAEVFGTDAAGMRDLAHALRELRRPGMPARVAGADGLVAVLPGLDPVLVREAGAVFTDLDAARAELARLERERTAYALIGDAHLAYLRAVTAERAARLRAARAAAAKAARDHGALMDKAAQARTAAREAATRLRTAAPYTGNELRARWRDLSAVRELDDRVGAWHDAVMALVHRELAELHADWALTCELAGDLVLPGPPPEAESGALAAWRRELHAAGAEITGEVARTEASRDGTAAWARGRAAAHEAGRRVADLESRLADARRWARGHEARVAAAAEAYRADLAAWYTEAAAFGLPGGAWFLDDLVDADTPRHVAERVRALTAPVLQRLTEEADAARVRAGQIAAELRDAPARKGPEPVAPWYHRVEFAPGVSPSAQAGLEAALEASGLLGARLCGDGGVPDPRAADRAIVVGQPVVGASLADVLVPVDAGDRGLAEALRGIGLGESAAPHWVGLDGRWRLGPVRGTGTKPHAEHIGAGNRERGRTRLDALAARRTRELETSLAEATSAADRAAAARGELSALLDRIPDGQDLRDAAGGHRFGTAAVEACAAELAEARASAVEARAEAARLRAGADPSRADVEALTRQACDASRLADRIEAAADVAGRLAARLDAYAALSAAAEAMRARHEAAEERYGAARAGDTGAWPPPSDLLDEYARRCDRLAETRTRLAQAAKALAARDEEADRAFTALRETAGALGLDAETPEALLALVAPFTVADDPEGDLHDAVERQRPFLDGNPAVIERVGGLLAVRIDEGFAARVDGYSDRLADRARDAERWYDLLAAELAERVRAIDATLDRLAVLLARLGLPGTVTWDPGSHRVALELLRTKARTASQDEQLRGLLAGLVAEQRRLHPEAAYTSALWHGLDPRTWGRWRCTEVDALDLALAAYAAAYPPAEGAARIIALDGLPPHRAEEVFELLARLDTDVIATGRDTWGHHGRVRELDAYELLRDPAGPAVAAVHVRWNGTR